MDFGRKEGIGEKVEFSFGIGHFGVLNPGGGINREAVKSK